MARDRNDTAPEKPGYEDSEKEEENERKSGKVRESSGSVIDEDRKRSGKSRRKARYSSDSDDKEEISRGRGERRKRKLSRRRYSSDDDEDDSRAVTNSWGKYGIIRETDMWTKRPEFTAWLAEVKQVNLESLPNWEEKQMFKEFMEDHNTATFPSKKYYNLDAYYQLKMEKEMKRGFKKVVEKERTVFNDEEQRRALNIGRFLNPLIETRLRQELLQAREKQKESEVEALKRSMQSGLAQAMKEQAQLREEMAYQYKLGNFEAAAAIQRRLDPDVAM
ncbi:hypothetical protein FEM48_Zijuj12G0099900 [Ziziphus jujuba var. spinosa]|uniref:Uncharacterized protein n=1 Tax=Ziziphus jujuba var. spinosa TaxID=714518 RepID=A0A978UCN3_ZIZJJ|nr:hypothetical protein FEM48_Zijuj12G0099900 [Ziziphus jujuba var. spinosa]